MLALDRVSRRFDKTAALEDFSLRVGAGEFVALLGPSGCGKSTALRIIAGLLRPDAGSLHWNGARPETGFVFQEPTLMPWADTLANVRLPLDLKNVARSEADARAGAALARVGLSGFERAFPRALSGGMKMRASIARSIVAGPKLLLMDEPFAALDELTRQSLNDDLLTLAREDGITVIFVTHNVYESVYLAGRVVVMTPRPGRVSADIALSPPEGRNASFRLTPEFADAAGRVSAALARAAA